MTPPPTAFSEPPPGQPSGGDAEAHTLVKLLTHQRDHYRQLKALSDRQQDLIHHGQAEQLLTVLGQRQGHVEALTTLNEQLAPLRPRMSQIAEDAQPEVRTHLRELVDDVQGLLEDIIQQDERDKSELSAGRDAVKQQLERTARTPAALSAYKVAAPSGAARFTDRRG